MLGTSIPAATGVLINANTTGRATNATNIASTGATNATDIATVSGLMAPKSSSFIAYESDSTLTAERVLSVNSGLSSSNAGSSFAIGHASTGAPSSNNSSTTFVQDILLDSFGHITGIGTATAGAGGGGAPTDATYITLSLDGDLDNERVLTAGSGIRLNDGGANGALTLSASGVTLGGVAVALGGNDATPAFNLQDATGLLTSNLNGTITNAQLAGSIANGKLANSSVTVHTQSGIGGGKVLSLGEAISIGVSGSTTSVQGIVQLQDSATDGTTDKAITPNAVFDIKTALVSDINTVSGLIPTATGVLINTNTTNISTKAPNDAQYLALATDGDLSAERVITAGSGVRFVDAGANGAFTVHASGITIAGTSTALGGSITADTIAGQISNDELSGDQINGGTINAITISELKTPLISFTDGDDAIAIGDSGISTFKAATKPKTNAASDGATITFNMDLANRHTVTLGADGRTLVVANAAAGQAFTLRLKQDNAGSRTVNWFSTIDWAEGGTAPTLTTTAGKADLFGFVCTTGGLGYDGFIIGQNI